MRLFFSGIGGAGLGPLANLALDAGYEVVGSDRVESHFTRQLKERGVEVLIGQNPKDIVESYQKNPFDWLVITSALPADHPDILFALANDIRVSKRHEVINQILEDKNLKMIAVSGTHGKTTTTGMMVWAMQKLGIPVSYSIGTNISFGPSAQYVEGSEYFVYEADEFDRNFLQYQPYASIIASIDYDHPDTYPTEEDYRQAFGEFIANNQEIVACWNQDFEKCKEYLPLKMEVKNPKPFVADALREDSKTQEALSNVELVGAHNRENAFLCVMILLSISEYGMEEITQALSSFPGTQRRFEVISQNIISDYAHHPDEILATIQMAREYMNKHSITGDLITVYQPHQNIRQHEESVQNGYRTCFGESDKVYWLPTYLSRENDLEVLTPEYLSNFVDGTQTIVADMDTSLHKQVTSEAQSGNLVLCLGAGTIDAWIREVL
jgi:UDP-N-acetylmuramate--alanine ligase